MLEHDRRPDRRSCGGLDRRGRLVVCAEAAWLRGMAAAAAANGLPAAERDAVSRYELGQLIAARDGFDPAALRAGLRPAARRGPIDLRLDGTRTQARLSARLRGAREFLAAVPA